MHKRLYRSRTDRMIWGVCGGLANYFDIDPVLVRIIFVLLVFANGIGILAYIILAIVVPLEGSAAATPREATRENIEEIRKTAQDFGEDVRSTFTPHPAPPPEEEGVRTHHRRNAIGLIIILAGILALMATLNLFSWFGLRYVWPALLILLGLFIIITARRAK